MKMYGVVRGLRDRLTMGTSFPAIQQQVGVQNSLNFVGPVDILTVK